MKKRLLSIILMALAITFPTLSWAQDVVGDETIKPYAVLSQNNTVLTFYYDEKKEERNGMGVGPFNYYTESLNQWVDTEWYEHRGSITSVVFDPSFADCNTLTSTRCWFYGLENLTNITGMENLVTDNVNDMGLMFCFCSKLTSIDVSHFNTSKVTTMVSMFNECSSLVELDVSGFNTENVTNMFGMFYRCYNLTNLDVSKFKTDKVNEMQWMFGHCTNLTRLDVSGFNTENVTGMHGMFEYCSSLTNLYISNFNTTNVTVMSSMFNGCSSLTSLDLSNFNTQRVTSMVSMFSACSNLTTIYVGEKWTTLNVREGSEMFNICPKLVGGAGTRYDANHTDYTYAHIDGGTANPGYLTDMVEYTKKQITERIKALEYELNTIYKQLEEEDDEDFTVNNARLFKEAVIQKATELKNLGGTQLEAEMQDIIDAVNNSGNNSSSKDEMMKYVDDIRMRVANLYSHLQMATTMEELRSLEEEEKSLEARTYDVIKEVEIWKQENSNNEKAFNTKNVSNYYETMWNHANQLNYQLFKDGDLFVAKGLIFKVIDSEKKTCQLGRGEGNWWPSDLWAAKELKNSECYEYIIGDYPPGEGGNYLDKERFTLPDQVLGYTLTIVGEAAFNQKSMNLFVLNESLEEIGNDAFATYGLKEIFIPKKVKKIGKLAFSRLRANMQRFEVDEQNPYLKHTDDYKGVVETATNTLVAACEDIEIPEHITALGDGIFYDCTFNAKVLPQNLQRIGTNTFQYCSNLTSIELPKTLKEIGSYAFYESGLQEISFPESITSIGAEAFLNCEKIKTIYAYWPQPIVIPENVFSLEHYENNGFVKDNTLYEQSTLYVPYGSKTKYQATEGWSKFQNIVEMEKTVIVVSLINNGDMEGEDNSNFFVRYDALGDQFKEVSKATITNGVGVNGTRGIKVEAKAKVVEAWDNQFWFRLNQPVSAGTKVRVSFDYRADREATISTESHAEPSTYIYYDPFGGDINVSLDWSHFEYEGTMDSNNSTDQLPFQSMTFTLNKYFEDANNYYFDNVEFEVILEDQCPKPTFKQIENSVIIQSPFDATIYYALDGSEPTNRSYVYSAPLALSDDAIINAIAIVEGYETSPVATYTFKFTQDENLEEKKVELRKMIEQLLDEADYCRARLSEKDRDQTSNLWQRLDEIQTEIAYAMKVLEDAKTEEDLIDCEKRIQIIAVELDRLRAEIEEYSPIHYSFDGLTAWVSGGVSLDEVFREVGGREVAAQTIAAIVWENSFALTADMLQGINNPNLLVYVNNASLAPQGVQNVVINGQAKEIVLTHATSGNNNWYCPQAFRAEKISYTRNFSQRTEIGKSRGWEGIALPFNVQAIIHESKGAIAPFGTGVGVKHFWLRAYDGENLYSAHEMEAYAPYIISMPNNDNYYADYNLNGRVTFSATNSEVYETPDFSFMENEPNLPLMTIPVFQRKAQSDNIYAINVGQARGSYAEGSVFERGLREVRPFEVYTVHHGQGARPHYIPISTQAKSDITGIKTIENDSIEGSWFSLDGRQMQNEPKSKGIYINNKKKIVLK